MLLAYDSNVLSDEFNVDDQIGDKVDIPTVIITKDVGEALKEYLSQPGHESVIMSIKFSGIKDNGYLDMKMFFRSDDVKSLSFFREFSYYKDKLLNKLTFTPVYKYNIYLNDETSNAIDDPDSEEQSTAPCVKSSHYCVSPNNDLKINNPRFILMENIRQSCIYNLFDLSEYWSYMEAFSELCADPNNPTFNPECSVNAMKSAGLYDREENITDCMHGLIENKAKIEDDYNLYNKKRVYKTPELMINGVKYRGDWYSRYIFNSICSGFIEDDEICGTPKPEEVKTSNFAFKIILYTILVIVILMVVLLICYRRYVNRSLEDTLNQKIEEQAMKVIGEYNAFKEKGGKMKDFFSRRGGSENISKLELVTE